jgi:hypothetical protein
MSCPRPDGAELYGCPWASTAVKIAVRTSLADDLLMSNSLVLSS